MNNWRKWLVLSTLMAALGGCAVVPMAPYDDRPVRVAPPPPRVEYPGYAPYSGYVWINGYWSWSGRDYVWIAGSWSAPRPGYRWTPHRWARYGDHWVMQGGRWESDGRAWREPPRAEPRREPAVVIQPRVQPVEPRYEAPRRDERERRGAWPYGQERHGERERQAPPDAGDRGAPPRQDFRPPGAVPLPAPVLAPLQAPAPRPAPAVATPPADMNRHDRGGMPGGRQPRGQDADRQGDEDARRGDRSRRFGG